MSFPAATTGVGVAARILLPGNTSASLVPGKARLDLSLSGANGPTTFQLNPEIVDALNNVITPGTAFTLTAVAGSSTTTLVLSAAAVNGVYTGTITGGGSNGLAGTTFIVAGFTNSANNGEFLCTASTSTTLTLANAQSVVETHAATAAYIQGTAIYTGTITGGGSNAFAGYTFIVAGFVTNPTNNGTFICTASSTTTLTLENAQAVAETHAATATSEEITGGNIVKYVVYGFKNIVPSQATGPVSGGTSTAVATVSATGLVTAVALGKTVVEASYPTFNNSVGLVVSSGNIMNGLAINKVFAELLVSVRV